MKCETSMDLSSAFKILGKGGGRMWNWDCNLKSFGAANNNVVGTSSANSKNTSGSYVKNVNDFLRRPGNMFLCLCILLLQGPGLVSCDTCNFPSRWSGSWFQKGSPDPIRIYNGTISTKGTCRENDKDKFLIENTMDKCFRCVVLHEKHINVLQYKESQCSIVPQTQSLDSLCADINGDALLYSMFRFNTPAVPCPFKGSFVFNYSRGHGECANPPSTVDSCTDDSHLLLRFQACADVIGSESRTEELVCLATWKEGSTRYLVGKLEHRVAKADEDKFRCFVYEQTEDGNGYLVAQSGDATCDGLFTPLEGSRTMRLSKANHPHAHCHYPEWFTLHRHWRGLDGKLAYDISHKNGSFRVSNATTGDVVKRVVCTQESSHHHPSLSATASTVATSSAGGRTYAQFVVHVTSGCNSGYACLRIHKRAPHVVELQTTNRLSPLASDACMNINFELNPSEIVTLTTQSYGSLDCPIAGIYSLNGPSQHLSRLISLSMEEQWGCVGATTLTSGCSAVDKMELMQECAQERRAKSFQCRGSWEENGISYVIATAVGTRKHLCLAYTVNDRGIQLSGSMEECLRNVQIGREGLITINGTSRGYCPTTDAATLLPCSPYFITLLSVISATATSLYTLR